MFLFGCDPKATGSVYLDSLKNGYIANLQLFNTGSYDKIFFHILFISDCGKKCQKENIFLNKQDYWFFPKVGIWDKKGQTSYLFKIQFDKERKDSNGNTIYPYENLKNWIKDKNDLKIYLISEFSNCKIIYKENTEAQRFLLTDNKEKKRNPGKRRLSFDLGFENEETTTNSEKDDLCNNIGGIQYNWRGKNYIDKSLSVVHEFKNIQQFKDVYQFNN